MATFRITMDERTSSPGRSLSASHHNSESDNESINLILPDSFDTFSQSEVVSSSFALKRERLIILPDSFDTSSQTEVVSSSFALKRVISTINCSKPESKQFFFQPFVLANMYASTDEPHMEEKYLQEMGLNFNQIKGWETVQPEKTNLYQLLREMIDKNMHPNLQIRIGEMNIPCHMIVLQCYSRFFMEFNTEILIELPEEKVTPKAFIMLYTWMLNDTPSVQREGILELFVAARFLKVEALVKQCWFCFADEVCFQEDAAFILYLEARNYDQADLEQLMLVRVCKFFLTVVATKEFLQLNNKEVCQLLSSNTIGVHSEIEILMSAVRWLSHDWDNRKQNLIEIAKCIRFSLMPSWYLVMLTKDTMSLEIHRVVKDPEVRQMISDGMSFIATRMHYTLDEDDFRVFLDNMHLTPPAQRQWICDKQCNYHYCCFSLNMASATYEMFKMYLERIRNIGPAHWRHVQLTKNLLVAP